MRKVLGLSVVAFFSIMCSNVGKGKIAVTLQMPDPDPKMPFIGCLRDRNDDVVQCSLEITCKDKAGAELKKCQSKNKPRVVATIAELRSSPANFLSKASIPALKVPLKFAKIEVQKESGSWVTLLSKEKVFDIAQLYLFETLIEKELPYGKYKALRFTLNPSSYSVYFGREPRGKWVDYPLTTKTAQAATILINKAFEFRNGKELELFVSLDPKKMLRTEPNEFIYHLIPQGQIVGIKGGEYTPVHVPLQNTFDNGKVAISAPANTFAESILFSAKPLAVADLPKPLTGPRAELLAAYDFQPSQTFKQPVTVTFQYDRTFLTSRGWSEKNLQVKFYDTTSGSWVAIPTSKIDMAAQKISVSVNHFTIIALSASGGFAVSMPDGVSATVSYDLLNSFSQKIFPAIFPELVISDQVQTTSQVFSTGTINAGANVTFTPDNISMRDFSVTASSYAADKVAFRLQLKRRISIGQLAMFGFSTGTRDCGSELSACKRGCPDDWWAESSGARDICYDGCNIGIGYSCFYPMSLATFSIKKWIRYFADRLDLTIILKVARNSNGSIQFVYEGEYIQNGGQNGWLDLTPVEERPPEITGSLAGSFVDTVVNIANIFFNHLSGNIFSGQMGSIGGPLAGALSGAFSNVAPSVSPQLSVNAQGFAYNADIYAEFNSIPDLSFFCATSPGLTPAANSPAGGISLGAGNHIGLGLSSRTLEQVLTEVANRGYMCYNGNLGTAGDLLRITPNATPTLTVDPATYKMILNLPVQVNYTSLANGTINATGSILLEYRIKLLLGASGMGFEFVGASHTLNQPIIGAKLDLYVEQLKNLKNTYPSAFDLNVYLPNPLGYAGIGASNFRVANFASLGGMMQMEFNVKGMELDYTAGGQSGSEWLALTSWTTAQGRCAPHLTGVPASVPYQVPYTYIAGYDQVCFGGWLFGLNWCVNTPRFAVGYNTYYDDNITFDNGQKIKLASRNLSPIVWNAVQNTRIDMYGTCNQDGSFNLQNVLNDNFNTTPNGDIYSHQNFVAQQVGPTSVGLGQYAINIHNSNLEEILTVIQDGSGMKLKWYLDNFLNDYNNPKTYTGDLPTNLGSNSVYLIKVIKRAAPLNDKIQINDKTYRIRVVSDVVYLDWEEPPTVTSISPTNYSSDVPPATSVIVNFSIPIDANSILVSNTSACLGSIQVSGDNFSSCVPMISTGLVFTNGNQTVTLNPALLLPGVKYQVKVLSTVTSQMSVPMAGDFIQSYGWTTAPYPNVTGVQPVEGSTNVSLSSPIVIVFDQPMNPATLTATTSPMCTGNVQVVDAQGICVAMTSSLASMAGGNTIATFTPVGLSAGGLYKIRVLLGVQSAASVSMISAYVQYTGWNTIPAPSGPGNLIWARQGGANPPAGVSGGKGVATDAMGNAYMAGSSTNNLDGFPFPGQNGSYVRKYDPSGNLIWTTMYYGGAWSASSPMDLAIDPAGDIFVAGFFGTDIDGLPPSAPNASDIFVAKINGLTGAKIWLRNYGADPWGAGNNGSVAPQKITCDASGNVIVTGGTVSSMAGQAITGFGNTYVIKIDGNGNRLWTRLINTPIVNDAYGVATNAAGEIFTTGNTYDSIDGQPVNGASDLMVNKFDANGNRIWSRLFGAPGMAAQGRGIVIDSGGQIYVHARAWGSMLGQTSTAQAGDSMTLKLDSSGTLIWARIHNAAPIRNDAWGIALDSAGNPITVGSTHDPIFQQGQNLKLAGYLTKLDTSGNILWSKLIGPAYQYTDAPSVTANPLGFIYVVGGTTGNLGDQILRGGSDYYLAKFQ